MTKALGRLLFLALTLFTLSGCAASVMQPAPTPAPPSANQAMVTFLRTTSFGGAVLFDLWDGENFIGVAEAGKHVNYVTTPGEHVFMAEGENWSYVKANLAPGKRYYVLVKVFPGVWMARVAFDPIRAQDEPQSQVDQWLTDTESRQVIGEKRSEYVTERQPKARAALAEYRSNGVKFEILEASDGR